MSDKPKIFAKEAMPVALNLVETLMPFCERIVIAGSLRRGNIMVSDVEILYIPKIDTAPPVKVDLFEEKCPQINRAEDAISVLLKGRTLAKRPNKNGQFTWGEKNKLATHLPSWIPVDLFATTKENWWVSLVIRTGGIHTNLRLTTGAQKLGRSLNAYGCGVTTSLSEVIPAHSEQDVFSLCGVKYLEPEGRE